MKSHSRTTYTIYLLTVWHDVDESANEPTLWRFRLENPRTKERWIGVGTDALTNGLVHLVTHEADLFLVMEQHEAKGNESSSGIDF